MEKVPGGSIQVLVVEDNPGDAGLIKEYLEESRYTAFQSSLVDRLSSAVEAMASRKFDVVLLDLNLPDSFGLDTVINMNKASREAAIIVLTGLSDDSVGFDAIRNGAQDFLVKGKISSDSLARTIRYSIERKKSERLSSALNDINNLLNSTLDLRPTLNGVIEKSAKMLGGKSAAIALLEDDIWKIRYEYQLPERFVNGRLEELDAKIPDLAAKSFDPVIIQDSGSRHAGEELVKGLGIKAILAVPLNIKGHTLGIVVFLFDQITKFNDSQIDFAKKLGISLSLVMENARLYEIEKSQRALLQAVTDNVPAAMFIIEGKDLRMKWTNPAFIKQTKMAPPSPGSKDLRLGDVLHNLDDSGIPKMIKEVVETKETKLLPEFRYLGSSRGETHWQVGAVPLVQPNNSVDVLVLAVDISDVVTARRQIEELAAKADEERRRLKAILDTLPVGVNIADENGTIVETNLIMSRIWGGKGVMPKGITDLKVFKGWWADTGMLVRPDQWGLARAIQKGETSIGEVIDIQRFDGTRGTILNSAAPIKGPQGEIIGALSVSQDITSQRQLEQEAVEAKMQAEFYLEILSQDINTLNANAAGYLEMALERMKLEEKQKGLLTKSLALLEDSSRLIETVNKIQQVESHDTKHGLIDVGWLLEDVKEEFIKDNDGRVSIRYTPSIKKMVIGGELLRDVFINLINSAVKYSSGKVEIDIALGKMFEGGREFYKVDIEDDGPGIPDEMKSKMFLRKQRGNPKSSGNGLGLYLVKKVVEAFHGRVWVEDRVPGDHSQGARFVVLLPVAAAR